MGGLSHWKNLDLAQKVAQRIGFLVAPRVDVMCSTRTIPSGKLLKGLVSLCYDDFHRR
jgi:hypothetical protein